MWWPRGSLLTTDIARCPGLVTETHHGPGPASAVTRLTPGPGQRTEARATCIYIHMSRENWTFWHFPTLSASEWGHTGADTAADSGPGLLHILILSNKPRLGNWLSNILKHPCVGPTQEKIGMSELMSSDLLNVQMPNLLSWKAAFVALARRNAKQCGECKESLG